MRLLVLVLAGCTGVAEMGESVPVGNDTATDPCAEVPALTWETFGHGFFIEHCNGCHASTTTDRHEAPEEVTFDTPAQAWALAERILIVAAGKAPEMPPNGGVDADDRTRLSWWFTCGVPGT